MLLLWVAVLAAQALEAWQLPHILVVNLYAVCRNTDHALADRQHEKFAVSKMGRDALDRKLTNNIYTSDKLPHVGLQLMARTSACDRMGGFRSDMCYQQHRTGHWHTQQQRASV